MANQTATYCALVRIPTGYGWLGENGSLHSHAWYATEFPNQDAMLNAVIQAKGELIDLLKIVEA